MPLLRDDRLLILRSRPAALLALLVAGAAGIAITTWRAVEWAADLPETVAFAVAREPFGSRSLLQLGNARAALDRVTARLGDGDEVLGLHLTDDRLSLTVREARDWQRWLQTTIRPGVEDRLTQARPEGRGFPAPDLAALDLRAPLAAAQRHWEAQHARPEPPLLSLVVSGGRPRGWTVIFTSEVPEAERVARVGLDGRAGG